MRGPEFLRRLGELWSQGDALSSEERRARLAVQAGGLATWEYVVETGAITGDGSLAALFDLPPAEGTIEGRAVFDAIHDEDRPAVEAAFQGALAEGGTYAAEFRVPLSGGGMRWLEGFGEGLRAADGGLRVIGFNADITERKEAELALARSERDARTILDSVSDGFFAIDRGWRIAFANEGAGAMLGRPPAELVGLLLWEAYPALRGSAFEPVYQAAMENGTPGAVTADGLDADAGRGRHYEARAYPYAGGISLTFRDVTDRKRAEEGRQLLLRELNHRVKNLFAIAVGMVSMTARSAKSPKAMAEAVNGRLLALARAHELIRPAIAADDARDTITLGELVRAVVEPHLADGEERLRCSGPIVEVGAEAATHLTLVLHELATNAAKYGALSAPAGRLAVGWSLSGDRLSLVWRETGGPPIAGPPASEGFGSKLAKLSVEGQLGGTIEPAWSNEGLTVTVVLATAQLKR